MPARDESGSAATMQEAALRPDAPARIAIGVQGRFHAFDLGAGLREQGAQVHLFTNYPGWAVRRFGFTGPATCHPLHGAVARVRESTGWRIGEQRMHESFGRWLAREIPADQFDVLHLWSGVAEETWAALAGRPERPRRALMRGSSHIRTQHDLLVEEEERAGVRLDRPSAWMLARELREYELSDVICCLSRFAYQTFLAKGVPASRLRITPLGVNHSQFAATPQSLRERRERIASGKRLRVLTVGTFSYQKGIFDYARIVERLHAEFDFRFVGSVPKEGRELARKLAGKVTFVSRVPAESLREHFNWGDIFLFPTLQDGFATVLNQASVAGLPVLATANSSAPDFVEEGRTGWVLPIREAEAFCERLRWSAAHRPDLAQMADQAAQGALLTWRDAGRLFLQAQDGPGAAKAERSRTEAEPAEASRAAAPRRARIGVVVHGRFHAFDLAKALERVGVDATLYTNYPLWVMKRFGVPTRMVQSCWPHGVATRIFDRLPLPGRWSEPFLHRWFGGWAARRVLRDGLDGVYVFSGVAEELILRRPGPARPVVMLMRSAAHIGVQSRLLREEEQRAGVAVDRPSPWMIDRESREYAQADWIGCPSTFVLESFLEQGVSRERLTLLPLSVDVKRYRPGPDVARARQERICSGAPLRVITLGNVSMQKGFVDYVEVVERMRGQPCEFRVVGHRLPEVRSLARRIENLVDFVDKVPFDQVPAQLDWADLMLFPTVQDGFPGVLVQAAAAGVPILTTTHSSGPDVIVEGRTGWVVPARDPAAMVERLRWALEHREELARMAQESYALFQSRTWDDVARDVTGRVAEAVVRAGRR